MPSLFLVELANGVKELMYCKVRQFYLNRIHDAHGAGVFIGLGSSWRITARNSLAQPLS